MGTDTYKDSIDHDEKPTSIQNEERKELPRKLKYLTAIAIFYGNVTLGCSFNTYGPAITSLQNKYETDDATISKVFTILTGCYMVGALCAGPLYNYVNRQFAVIIILMTMAAMMFLTPHCPSLTTFFLSAAVMGLAIGLYDVAQFVWMMEMMQEKCPPFVQSQHFFYAVGTNLASLIMAPFLDEDDEDNPSTTILSPSLQDPTNNHTSIRAEGVGKNSENDDSKLFIPYTIVGVLGSVTVIAQILLYIFLRYYPPPPEINEEAEKQQVSENEGKREIFGHQIKLWSFPKFRVIILSAVFFGAYSGMEMCTFQFFPKFSQNSELSLSESESAYVLTGMTAAYAVGRAIAIIAVFKIATQLILCANIVLIIVGNVLLVGWSQRSLPTLWSSSIILGLGFSSMYGSFCAYIERYLNFTNFIGSIMIVFGSGTAAIYPLIVGTFIENNPVVLGYTLFFSIALVLISFGTLSYLTHKNKTRY